MLSHVAQEPPLPEVAVLDPDAAPLYWREPGMLLDLFGEMAERNLFLVQHLQVRRTLCAACYAPRGRAMGCTKRLSRLARYTDAPDLDVLKDVLDMEPV